MNNGIALYVHIPFCISKCAYCDFFSMPCGERLVPDDYIRAVVREASYRCSRSGAGSLRTVYVGGGTPSLMSPRQLSSLMDGIMRAPGNQSARPLEITVEMNPCDVTPEKLAAAEDAGVTRISVGIQSLDGAVLSAVNRRSGRADVERALDCIGSCWHGDFSADIISGLPGETMQSFSAGLEELAGRAPGHVSLYSLTLEEHTPLGDAVLSGIQKYDYDAADSMWIAGRDFLVSRGYTQYEVSNFCLPGKECLHNASYWNQEDYIGCGAGATGTIYGTHGGVSVRQTNTKDIEAYTAFWLGGEIDGPSVPAETEYLQPDTVQFEFFMMGLRTASGVCREVFEERFGMPFPRTAERLFAAWQSEGKSSVETRGGRHYYSLTPAGLLFLNEFLEQL